MLHTNLQHVMSADEHKKLIEENENVMIVAAVWAPCVFRCTE